MKVPWISKKKIASRAAELIQNFEAMAGYTVRPPIPVEDIVERYLSLRLIYDNLERILGRDILGATYVESRTICINERLFENSSEGRLVFTCSHEAGHWVLHRQYVKGREGNGPGNNAIVCTTTNAKQPIEWQADYFASCLLMPEQEIREAFHKVCSPGRSLSGMPEATLSKEVDPTSPMLNNGPLYQPPCVNWAGSATCPNMR